MKKILMSVAMLAFVGAVIAGATGAFFSDTETSSGNTFTAGAIDLTVDSEQHYNGNVCVTTDAGQTYHWEGNAAYPVEDSPCDGTWLATDLGAETFFNFGDIKPGDEGENTISLHIDNNDAWACVDVDITANDDMSSTEPELESGDQQDTTDLMDGELAQNIYFTAWADDGDNIWESGEPLLFSNQSGPASDVLGGKTYVLADSTTGNPLTGGETTNIGLAWCAGDMTLTVNPTVGQPNTIDCDGSAMGNNTQTDSLVASIAFRVEQSRNNENFVCGQQESTPESFHISLENKDINWSIIANDSTFGDIQYSSNDSTFHGTVTGTGLVPNGKYQITLNGPGTCTATDDALVALGSNAFQSGYWNNGTGLESTCGTPGEGVYNMDLVADHYTFIADESGAFTHNFDFALPVGSYSGVKVLVKKMLDTHVSPWSDTTGDYPAFNLYETASINFTII